MTYKDYTNFALLITESALDYHDPELVEEICNRAGLSDAYAASHGDSSADGGETFESVYYRALEILENEDDI